VQRRGLLIGAGLAPLAGAGAAPFRRVRPGEPGWPSDDQWAELDQRVGGRLLRPRSPFAEGASVPWLRNPFALGDDPAMTETSGWAEAWASAPSAYAVAARDARDVAAAVDFARTHRLRLVVKGGGHSYQGTSSAPDSLLVWTRPMQAIALHDAFVPAGCAGPGLPAVSLGAGAIWGQAYDAVTTRAGRYVQGGGCTTVGVAGLVQSGGFGSFSRRFGTAAGNLLEAEVVTADGVVRTANACTHPDLFWALKGGGGGSFGVVTRVTLRTHPLPETFGVVLGTVRAATDAAWLELVGRLLGLCAERLVGPDWGEQLRFGPGRTLTLGPVVFQGMTRAAVEAAWRPFLDAAASLPGVEIPAPFQVLDLPARHLWDAAWLRRNVPAFVRDDDRPGAPPERFFSAADAGQVGYFLHAYQSAWLPASLLAPEARGRLAAALVEASRHWSVSLHLNKGLAGAALEAVGAARETAMHPAALEAFALAIASAAGPPSFPGQPGPKPDLARARAEAARVTAAMDALRALAPDSGAYVSEGDFFQRDWQRAAWGAHYPRLLEVKRRYDPDGLFFVHHGVGTEGWSADGFERLG
jgi:FAD/FMN-containing dehydrogenase